MHKEAPPATAPEPGQRRNKFSGIVAGLLADPGEWYNITDDIVAAGAEDKGPSYFAELARSITAGNRAGFRPRGAFQGRAEGTQIWAKAVPEDEREAALAVAEAAAQEAAEAGDEVDPDDDTAEQQAEQELEHAF